MATSTLFNYHCEAWQAEDFEIEDDPQSPYAVFLIRIFAQHVNSPMIWKEFLVSQSYLVYDSMSWSAITKLLFDVNVPLHAHPRMIQEIKQCARSIMSDDHNINRKTIPMVVVVKAVQLLSQEEEIFETIMESMNSHVSRYVPATKSSIEALETVKAEGLSKQCVICLEEILIGSEATRIPCLHVYHPDCIVNWLEKSNICPLCRFQMPTCDL